MKDYKKIAKNLMVLALAFSLLIPMNFHTKGADDVLTDGDFQYKVVQSGNEKEAKVYGYTGQSEDIVIPETLGGYKVTYVNSLDGCKASVKSLSISKNVKGVSDILEVVDSVGKDQKIELEKYEVVSDNPYLSVKDGVLFNKDQTMLLNYPRGKKDEKYTEPSTVKFSNGASQNGYVKSWVLSVNKENLKTADYGYWKCANLEEVVIPENIVVIGEYSFANCTKLKNINWTNKLERIGENAFNGCTSIKGIKIPSNVISIAESAFNNCDLTWVKLSNRINYIGAYAFNNNPRLSKVKIPDSVTKMSKNAFDQKTKVTMASYMKKEKGHFNYYLAKATLYIKGKAKDYNAVNITKIKPTKKKVNIKKGKSQKLYTKGYIYNKDLKLKKNGKIKNNILQFTSSNKKVVKVTSSGKIKALKKGTAVITVTLRTAKESYKSKEVKGQEGTVQVASIKMTKKTYKVKVKVK